MLALVYQEIEKNGDKAKVIPLKRLQDIKQDIEQLKGSGQLNDFQKFIVNDIYRFDAPATDFEVRSILIVASPSPARAKIVFNRQGKRIPLMLPASYIDKDTVPVRIERYLSEFLNPKGYHVKYAPRLPRKRIAVRSGLGVYGRNNICYVDGLGSFLNLTPFFSDIPCDTGEAWQEVRAAEACKSCEACLSHCPTAAILEERFLINNERCLTYFNEAGAEWNFPDWIDRSAHNAIYGCMRCQTVCPMNQEYLGPVIEPAEFTAEETLLLMAGKPYDEFSETLKKKVGRLNMVEYLGALPRNLSVLFDQ